MEPVIKCAFKELVEVSKLTPNPKNPNVHSASQLKLFVEILKEQGFRRPVTVSIPSGYVVKGHGLLEAAKLAGYITVPVDYQDYDSSEQEMADLLADNQLARLSTTDGTKLKDALEDLSDSKFDLTLTGFDLEFSEKLLAGFQAPSIDMSSSEETDHVESQAEGTPDATAPDLTGEKKNCPHCGGEL